ncbi:hypothetical protein EXIGLDRAFT_746993 [Exidia glandulosa HHB12029]|uniref:Uncharacterized protein n=1 Tax=Exidia glandulosa HHB12029 TaxID=1314781 RepID=A0A165LAK1_EXIGL|nr:hypothetical protein EXIGLDRAFT_746993 [Exidia glandulosa HHB12029]
MHGRNTRTQTAAEGMSHILDPCYHVDSGDCTPCSINSSRSNSTWSDDMGTHDPDFHPFEVASTTPRRDTFAGAQSQSPRTKAGRIAARNQLDTELRAAIIAHELELEQERRKERRSSWTARRRSADYEVEAHEVEEDDESALDTTSAESVEYAFSAQKPLSSGEHVRQRLASLSLRVDFAVFRAKKHLRRRAGLD